MFTSANQLYGKQQMRKNGNVFIVLNCGQSAVYVARSTIYGSLIAVSAGNLHGYYMLHATVLSREQAAYIKTSVFHLGPTCANVCEQVPERFDNEDY